MAVQFAMLTPGDTIMGMNLDHGGHLTHDHRSICRENIFMSFLTESMMTE